MLTKESIHAVYADLKNRVINPAGAFDKQGRFYAEHGHLINVRSPSRAWPYSQMQACRTLKYVKAVAAAFDCATEQDLRNLV